MIILITSEFTFMLLSIAAFFDDGRLIKGLSGFGPGAGGLGVLPTLGLVPTEFSPLR